MNENEESIRFRAYLLWEKAGSPSDVSPDKFWLKAKREVKREQDTETVKAGFKLLNSFDDEPRDLAKETRLAGESDLALSREFVEWADKLKTRKLPDRIDSPFEDYKFNASHAVAAKHAENTAAEFAVMNDVIRQMNEAPDTPEECAAWERSHLKKEDEFKELNDLLYQIDKVVIKTSDTDEALSQQKTLEELVRPKKHLPEARKYGPSGWWIILLLILLTIISFSMVLVISKKDKDRLPTLERLEVPPITTPER